MTRNADRNSHIYKERGKKELQQMTCTQSLDEAVTSGPDCQKPECC